MRFRKPRSLSDLRRLAARREVGYEGHTVTRRYRLVAERPELVRIRFLAVRGGLLRRGLHAWGNGTGIVTRMGWLDRSAVVWAHETAGEVALVQAVPTGRLPLTVEIGNIWRTATPPALGSVPAVPAEDGPGYDVQGGLQCVVRGAGGDQLLCAQTVDDAPLDRATWRELFGDLVVQVQREPLDGRDVADLIAGFRAKQRDAEARAQGELASVPARTQLPAFRYHPDPVRTGAFVRSTTPCALCAQTTGWAYAHTAGSSDLQTLEGDGLCPWCIASGRAASVFGATFVDFHPYGGPRPAEPIVAEVEQRTPGLAWRYSDGWFVHCGDACAYLAAVDRETVHALPAEQQAAIRHNRDFDFLWREPDGRGADLDVLHLFQCLHCGRYDMAVL